MSALTPAFPVFDQGAAEAFTERFVDILNSGAIAVMCSIGHRTGLFDAMTGLPPSSSQTIAERAGLDERPGLAERYVREWLAVMVNGRIVAYDAAAQTYQLPAEHAAILARRAPLGNVAVAAQFVPLMGAVQEHILECFATGCGTSYDQYPCFHRVMAEDSGQTVVDQLFDAQDLTGFDAVHDGPDPESLIRTLHRALRPGGVYLMQDNG